MAARIRKLIHDEETRARIKTTQLANRLTKHAFGKLELSPSQVRAIEILLKKTLPDMSNLTLSGDANNPLRWEGIQRNVIDPHEAPVKTNGHATNTNGSGVQAIPDSEPL